MLTGNGAYAYTLEERVFVSIIIMLGGFIQGAFARASVLPHALIRHLCGNATTAQRAGPRDVQITERRFRVDFDMKYLHSQTHADFTSPVSVPP